VQNLNYLELEQEIDRLTTAITARNLSIGKDLIENLKSRFELREIAGMFLVSLSRLVWLDSLSFCWAVENLIPGEVMREIRNITTVSVCKRLIDEGLLPGQDFSVDSVGCLLLNEPARTVVLNV
jgi:N-acetylglutamate synthase-like GNAT family acetyltransferase